jgi:hypothetical protein
LGVLNFYVEEYGKPPIQCRKCKGLGQTADECTSSHKLGFCSEEHDENDCKKKQNKQAFKFTYCNQNHSANYRGCFTYQQAKN